MRISWVPRKVVDRGDVEARLSRAEESNRFANFGPNASELETRAAGLLRIGQDRRVVAVCSGAAAIQALVGALCIEAGRKLRFAVQAFTFPCSVQGLLLDSLVVDLAPGDLSLDLAALELLSDDFDGLVITNPNGTCVDIGRYVDFCQARGKRLLFDNAATPYTFYRGRNCCDYGDGAAVSLHHTKPLGFGEGGLAIVRQSLYPAVVRAANFGYTAQDRTCHSQFAGNHKLSEVAAIYCLQHLRFFREIVDSHARLACYFYSQLPAPLTPLPTKADPDQPALLSSLAVIFPRSAQTDFFGQLGIEAKKYYAPLNPELPVAADLYQRIISFPLHRELNPAKVDYILQAIRDYLAEQVPCTAQTQ